MKHIWLPCLSLKTSTDCLQWRSDKVIRWRWSADKDKARTRMVIYGDRAAASSSEAEWGNSTRAESTSSCRLQNSLASNQTHSLLASLPLTLVCSFRLQAASLRTHFVPVPLQSCKWSVGDVAAALLLSSITRAKLFSSVKHSHNKIKKISNYTSWLHSSY